MKLFKKEKKKEAVNREMPFTIFDYSTVMSNQNEGEQAAASDQTTPAVVPPAVVEEPKSGTWMKGEASKEPQKPTTSSVVSTPPVTESSGPGGSGWIKAETLKEPKHSRHLTVRADKEKSAKDKKDKRKSSSATSGKSSSNRNSASFKEVDVGEAFPGIRLHVSPDVAAEPPARARAGSHIDKTTTASTLSPDASDTIKKKSKKSRPISGNFTEASTIEPTPPLSAPAASGNMRLIVFIGESLLSSHTKRQTTFIVEETRTQSRIQTSPGE